MVITNISINRSRLKLQIIQRWRSDTCSSDGDIVYVSLFVEKVLKHILTRKYNGKIWYNPSQQWQGPSHVASHFPSLAEKYETFDKKSRGETSKLSKTAKVTYTSE